MFANEILELSAQVGRMLRGTGLQVATAESCTSGLVAAALTSVSGSSEYVKGGVVAYSSLIKESVLGVSHDTIERCNVVSSETVAEMAKGALRVMNADIALATTGVAGPTGGTSEIPVGTIWVGVAMADEVVTRKLTENIGRSENIENAVAKVLEMMLEIVKKKVNSADK